MSNNAIRHKKPTDAPTVRPAYFLLGVDGRGNHHVRDVRQAAVHIISPTGGRERLPVADDSLAEYMGFVAERAGWAERNYGGSWADQLVEAIEP